MGTYYFKTAELEYRLGVTARQVRWWIERSLVGVERKKRGGPPYRFSPAQARDIAIVAELRRKMPHPNAATTATAIRQALRLMRRLGPSFADPYLVVSYRRAWRGDRFVGVSLVERGELVDTLAKSQYGAVVVDVAEAFRMLEPPAKAEAAAI